MYLSKLELHGFKSFADRTLVNFSPGITVVVGPNGCGKSNIVDAVRWVIGEQRARILRSEKMENVIFNGAGTRRGLGMAEVMLTIENTRGVLPTEYTEVTLGRRLYRSGESEYLLNGVQCRLKDITDLFMDTGMGAGAYSVIELKMIEELLSENAMDRRRLFEEAAGITKYKIRRAQTLRKLSGTQADLTRVRDITEELDRRVRSLERQARKASRYTTLRDRLHELELALAQLDYDRLTSELSTLKTTRKALGDRLEGEGARLAKAEAEHEAARTLHVEREQAVVAEQTRLSAHTDTLRKAESDQRITLERLRLAAEESGRLIEAQEASALREQALLENRETLDQSVALAEPAAQEAGNALDVAQEARDTALRKTEEERRRLHEVRDAERAAGVRMAEHRRQLDRTSSRLEMLSESQAGVTTQLEQIRDRITEAERIAADAQEHRDRAAASRDVALEALTGATDNRERLTSSLESAQQELHAAQRRMDAASAEVNLLESLLASFEDFTESVQFLAEERDWSDSDDLRTVADLIGCDPHHRNAVEAALGEYAGCLVVSTESEARRAVGRLRDSDKGRATFIVLERVGSGRPRLEMGDGVQPLLNVIRVADEHLALATLLLGDAGLVDNLDDALSDSTLASGLRLFTLAGEWVRDGGILHAGSTASTASVGAGRLGRREQLDAARSAHDAAARDVATHAALVDDLRTKLGSVGVAEAETHYRDATRALADSEQRLTRAVLERDQLKRRSGELTERLEHLTGESASSTDRIAELSEAVSVAEADQTAAEARRVEFETAFQTVEADSRRAVGVYSEAKIHAVQAGNRLDMLRRDIARTVESIGQLRREREERADRIEHLADQQTKLKAHAEELTASIESLRDEESVIGRELSRTKDALGEAKVVISNLEASLREIRRTREASMAEDNRAAVRMAEVETRAEDLLASVSEDYDVDLTSTRIDEPEEFDPATAREEVGTLRSRIRNLGPVNELALETFEEEQERLTFLQTQLQDLEGAEATLLETITEINTTASQRFDETFKAIRDNFARLFRELFGEDATADVVLADPDDPLESAIEIFAKPRGKKPSVLAQLSGGEKTLTAIALLFAIYLVKPSPFCILDEVDAPLDDANVDRFMHLIRSFAATTQFILVTHNKRTMESADRMYGITMQEQGVSRLVGVRFDEEPESPLELVA